MGEGGGKGEGEVTEKNVGTEEFERKTARGGKEGKGKGRKTVGKEGEKEEEREGS